MKPIGTQISVHVEPVPSEDECCTKCGADSICFEKHPVLIGGNCAACGEVWLPALTFGTPEPIYKLEATD
jgi:hypothetical protein